jgi:type IX secretion system substrate protein
MKIKIVTIAALLFFSLNNFGQKEFKKIQQTSAEQLTFSFLNCNNISTIFYGDGTSDTRGGQSRFQYPKGTHRYAVYATGLVWGAYIEGDAQVKVSGTTFSSLLQPGKILNDGSADDPELPKYRVYRVRNDVFPGGPNVDLYWEMKDEGYTYDNVRSRYETDWNEWPAEDGAPFIDKNKNGIYEPEFDKPGVEHAKQTIWYVANDLAEAPFNVSPTHRVLGIEMQVTIWAYDNQGILSNMLFRKHKLINKSQNEFKDMYISLWSDPDVGGAGDDFVGTDTASNMVYAYNSDSYDHDYQNMTPPASGFQLLQGPIVVGKAGKDKNKNSIDDAIDHAIYDNKLVGPGLINLPMTSSYFPVKNLSGLQLWNAEDANNSYLFFQGINAHTGEPYIDPNTGEETVYPYSGDPVGQTGWIEGENYPGDRRVGFVTGPFNLAAGDTQEVVTGHLAAIGSNHLESINELKYLASEIQSNYDELIITNNFPAPPSPEIEVISTLEGIKIQWDQNEQLISSIENYNSQGYTFQGYNVYLERVSKSSNAIDSRIAVFDIVDGVKNIFGEVRDSLTGFPSQGIIQYGNDSGIKRSIMIDKNLIDDLPLVKGREYLFGVSAYTYNSNPQNNVRSTESGISYESVTYLNELPGPRFGDNILYSQESGSGDEDKIDITIVDPNKLTGDEYEIYFTIKNSYRGNDGKWHQLNKKNDLTGSRLEAGAVFGETTNTIEINFNFINESPDYAWMDGVILTFPEGVNIVSAPNFENRGGTLVPQVDGRQVIMGLVNNELTRHGFFQGGEKWSIIVQNFTPPIQIEYLLKDDGGRDSVVDVFGNVSIDEIAYETKTEKFWHLKNVSKGNVVLENQTVMDGFDIYTKEFVGNPVVDGFQINIIANYEMPRGFNQLFLNSTQIPSYCSTCRYEIHSGRFWIYNTASDDSPMLPPRTSLADSTLLWRDYELRFTGELKVDIFNGDTVEHVFSGGQYATFYGAREYELADHPMNPYPGSNNPFIIRVPFELWDIDENRQVNMLFYDFDRGYGSDVPFQAWNKDGDIIITIVLSNYNGNVIDTYGAEVQNYATWNLSLWECDWQKGDVLKVKYKNSITPYDRYTFKAPYPFDKNDFGIPDNYYLLQNYPNPFNPNTTIRFRIPEPNLVKLDIFNILGQKVRTLVNDFYEAGTHHVRFSSSGLSSGIYFYRIESGNYVDVKKMLLLK